jgi:hypothetical protein
MKVFALLAMAACAQSYSSHSGWNFNDTLQTATDIVVADLTAGSAADSGSQVAVQGPCTPRACCVGPSRQASIFRSGGPAGPGRSSLPQPPPTCPTSVAYGF